MTKRTEQLLIQTCILQQKEFVPLDMVGRLSLDDPGRVEGSVRISANGVKLITDLNWTELVQWWAQIIQLLENLAVEKRQSVVGYFPDSPTTMQLTVHGSRLTWEVNGATTRSTTLDFGSTIQALFESCETFFTRIKTLNPNSPYDQDRPLADLAKLAPAIRDATNPQQ